MNSSTPLYDHYVAHVQVLIKSVYNQINGHVNSQQILRDNPFQNTPPKALFTSVLETHCIAFNGKVLSVYNIRCKEQVSTLCDFIFIYFFLLSRQFIMCNTRERVNPLEAHIMAY